MLPAFLQVHFYVVARNLPKSSCFFKTARLRGKLNVLPSKLQVHEILGMQKASSHIPLGPCDSAKRCLVD